MIITPLCFKIFVRYARKPIWSPTAKSKLFRIAEHNFYNEDECKQIRLLQSAYAAQEASIQEFMKQEFYIPATQSGGLPTEFINKELEGDRLIYEENDRVNAEIAKMKGEILGKNLKELEERLIEEKLRIEDQLAIGGQKVDEYINKRKSDPDAFVTPKNIESLIEKAIENPVSFEYCINQSGRQYGYVQSPESKHQAVSGDV